MAKIKFSNQDKSALINKLQSYFENELDQELEQFDAEFLLDFFSQECGAYYYNQGLKDARAIFETRMETVDAEIYAIEQDTK
ncbi:DUF2164 domain-containing protein [Shewanella aestuarii]|uniref:DUF2164 domain-containing protein n=1 Tax=Shewanella aestuarii TaxID=1028752 RepID=A0A6G9QJ99_9GAMM|nr:DUF2164 domain-containing protein [Shewanella aestuarii]QIR14213.1 DUF2164 domain-containing protein [Shewanella aestuarii]